MMRRRKSIADVPFTGVEQISDQSITEYSTKAMTRYATAVNLDRAIPELYDGLKPVARRVAWSATSFKGGPVKSARITGHCFAKGTLVTFATGHQVPIEDCRIGDEVLTDTGYSYITCTYVNHDCDLYRIKLSNDSFIDATSDQIFYCIDINGNKVERTPLTMQLTDKILSY